MRGFSDSPELCNPKPFTPQSSLTRRQTWRLLRAVRLDRIFYVRPYVRQREGGRMAIVKHDVKRRPKWRPLALDERIARAHKKVEQR